MMRIGARDIEDCRTMNVCIVTGIFPPDAGGPATYVPQIATALSRRGHRVNAVTLSDSYGHDDSCYGFPVDRILRWWPKWRRVPRAIWSIAKKARHADIVFANGLFAESTLAAWLVRKPLAIKIVGDWAWEREAASRRISDSIDRFQEKRYSLKIEMLKMLRSWVAHQADVILVPSHYLQQLVVGWGVSERRVKVIYNAVGSMPNTAVFQLPSFDGYTVVTVARLVPWKGIDGLIRVISRLSKARLLVIGDGPERTGLEQLAVDLRVDDRVSFVGRVPKDSVSSYLRVADVFVLNSAYEGLPHIVLEAIQVGTAVVATNAGGIGEVVRDGVDGVLVPIGDDDALQEAIGYLLHHPVRRKEMEATARQRVADQFTWEQLVDETEAVLVSFSRDSSDLPCLETTGVE